MEPQCLMAPRSEKGTGGGHDQRGKPPWAMWSLGWSSAHQISCDPPDSAEGGDPYQTYCR